MYPTEKSRQFHKDRFDILSIPGYVIKKNQLRVWRERRNTDKCIVKSVTFTNYDRRFLLDKPDGDWDKTAERMVLHFVESGHPIFRATNAQERGELRSKAKGKKSIHSNGSEETIELILRTAISVNQLTIYGAVADLCGELSKDSRVSGKPDANEYLETVEIPTELPVADPHTDRETCCNITSVNSTNFLKTRNYPNCAATSV